MKKKLLLILIILIVFISAGIIYLNNIILPTKIKILIINTLQEKTQKKISIESLQFNIFKGLVLKNLIIYDDKKPIINLKESSCTFLIWPFFKKMIIIPNLRFRSPQIFLERRKDNTINLQDLFLVKKPGAKPGFKIYVYKINVTGAAIQFVDNVPSEPFTKNIDNLDLNVYLSLPDRVKFNLKADIVGPTPANIKAAGEFKMPVQQLAARISVHNLSPREFWNYYPDPHTQVSQGLMDCLIDLKTQAGILSINLQANNKNLVISQDKISVNLSTDIQANLQYGFKDKELNYSLKATITDSQILGLKFADTISAISGELILNNSGLYSDKLTANALGLPIEAKISLSDFKNPLVNISIASKLNLASIQGILKEKFKFIIPLDIRGQGSLSLLIQKTPAQAGAFSITGYLDVLNAGLKLEKMDFPFENINGRLEFSQNQLKWENFNFQYSGLPYKITGTLTNFQSPSVQCQLSSPDLFLDSAFATNNKIINVSKCTGTYRDSGFSLTGDINIGNPPSLETDINGELDVSLKDTQELLGKFKEQINQIKPEGLVHAQLHIAGNIKDIKSCTVTAKLLSSDISAYGLKAGGFLLDYNQANGIGDISQMHLSLYDGMVDVSAKMNLTSPNLPYWISADVKGVKIEKLKLDTTAKEKDISGTITADVKVNGFSNDISKLSGTGRIFINEGKLWQLNLFKGLGSLLFAREFADIVFHQGSCTFFIQNKYIATDNLRLSSNITDLAGAVKIGFDKSIDASLNVEVLDEMVPLSGTFKDVTTAIIGKAGRFGVIKISGTLREPKYKFQPAIVDIITGIKDIILGK
jgi:hypothetical protein